MNVEQVADLEESKRALAEASSAFHQFLTALANRDPAEIAEIDPLPQYLAFMFLGLRGMHDVLQNIKNEVAVLALARTIQETFVGLFYFCAEEVEPAERDMRSALWRKNVHGRHLEQVSELQQAGSIPTELLPLLKRHESSLKLASEVLRANACIGSIKQTDRRKAGKLISDINVYLADYRSDIWARSGLGQTFRRSYDMYSQVAHCSPWIVDLLIRGAPGVDHSRTAILMALICLSKSIKYTLRVCPDLEVPGLRVVHLAEQLVSPTKERSTPGKGP